MDLVQGFSGAFMPHGMCYLWQPGLLWTHVLADGFIALAYFAIPATLAYSVYRGRQILEGSDRSPLEQGAPYGLMFLAFGVFILACGLTHVLGIWTVWRPDYWWSGGAKAVTAVASVATAIALPPLVPKALELLRDARMSDTRRRALEQSSGALQQAQALAGLHSFGWDPETGAVSISEEMLTSYGFGGDTPPTTLPELLDPWNMGDDADVMVEALAGAAAGRPAAFEVSVGTGNRSRILHTSAGLQPDGTVLVTQVDVTQARSAAAQRRLRKEEARARARAEAEQARLEERNEELARVTETLRRRNEELDRFAYVASHDLKAPLRGIANLATFLGRELEDRPTDRSDEFLGLMKGRVHKMEGMVDGLLAYSRVGRTTESIEEIQLEPFVRDIVQLLDPPPDLAVHVDVTAPTLRAERVRLHQVVQNLVSNALRYADSRIGITAKKDGAFIEFSVSDDGMGIAPQHQDRIWEIFQRLDPDSDAPGTGTGIGLSLVQKIMREQGGRAWVESSLGEGATFRFTWPLDPRSDS